MRWLFVMAMLPLPVWGQFTLYTCMVTSKDYVVGAKLPPSGIFLKSAAGEWRHAGYNHPDRKSTRLNSSHLGISYADFCLKKKQTGAACGLPAPRGDSGSDRRDAPPQR